MPERAAAHSFSETHQNKKPPRQAHHPGRAKHVLLPALPARVTRNQFDARLIGL
jgi:hypothetical protein